jgi:hypothetical protein
MPEVSYVYSFVVFNLCVTLSSLNPNLINLIYFSGFNKVNKLLEWVGQTSCY